jgi:hypothetical protein
MSHHSVSTSGDNASEIVMTAEEHQEFQNLPMLLTQWKRIQEEKQKLLEQKRVILEQVSELDKRSSAMAGIMMGTMKKHSIAALDLKSSNARVVYKKSSRKAPLPKKEMTKLMAEHMKSETAAKELLAFLDAKKTTKVKEALVYEKNVEDK